MMLALAGIGLGGFALREGYFGAANGGSPNRFERESRTLAVLGPVTTGAKAAGRLQTTRDGQVKG
jgi:hypothetical protein